MRDVRPEQPRGVATRAVEAARAVKPMPAGPRVRKQPIRTCVACRTERPKRDLVRVVRTPDGDILLDASGRLNGRGAYLCPNLDCFHRAIKRRALDRTLGVAVPQEQVAPLEEGIRSVESSQRPDDTAIPFSLPASAGPSSEPVKR